MNYFNGELYDGECQWCGDSECDCEELLESYDDLESLWDSILSSSKEYKND